MEEIVTPMTNNVHLVMVPNFKLLSNLVIMNCTEEEITCLNSLSPKIIGTITNFNSFRAKEYLPLYNGSY